MSLEVAANCRNKSAKQFQFVAAIRVESRRVESRSRVHKYAEGSAHSNSLIKQAESWEKSKQTGREAEGGARVDELSDINLLARRVEIIAKRKCF